MQLERQGYPMLYDSTLCHITLYHNILSFSIVYVVYCIILVLLCVCVY